MEFLPLPPELIHLIHQYADNKMCIFKITRYQLNDNQNKKSTTVVAPSRDLAILRFLQAKQCFICPDLYYIVDKLTGSDYYHQSVIPFGDSTILFDIIPINGVSNDQMLDIIEKNIEQVNDILLNYCNDYESHNVRAKYEIAQIGWKDGSLVLDI